VKAPVATAQASFEFVAVADITFEAVEGNTCESAGIAPGPQESPNLVTTRGEFMNQVGADESRGARDEAIHKVGLKNFSALPKVRKGIGSGLPQATAFEGLAKLKVPPGSARALDFEAVAWKQFMPSYAAEEQCPKANVPKGNA
jgi:hypothetical protein